MSKENPDDLGKRVRELFGRASKHLTSKQNWEAVGNYLTDRRRLESIAILGATIGGAAILKDQLPEATKYIRDTLPFLSKEVVSLTVDTLTNTLLAPLGYLLSNYAHGKNLSKKEFLGHVAFAGAWGVARHYVYSGLSNFDEITPLNTSLKTSLYTLYYAAYGGVYATFTEWWSKVCSGVSKLEAIEGVGKSFQKRLDNLAKDPGIQFNLALNILNMFNPWVESRPTVAGGLLIQYNMDIIRHSDKGRNIGFFDYLKGILAGDYSGKAKIETSSDVLIREKVPMKKLFQPTIFQRIAGASELAGAALAVGYGVVLPLGPLSLSAYSFYDGNIVAGVAGAASSVIMSFPAWYCIKMGQYFGKIGKARFNGVQGEDLERIKYDGLKTFHPKDPRNRVIDNFIEREFGGGAAEYLISEINRTSKINQESEPNTDMGLLKEDLPLAYGKLSNKSTDRLKRRIDAFRRFDMERAYYSRAEIEDILRREGVIGNGLLGQIHLAWIFLAGMEFFYHTKLKFKSGTYRPYVRSP